MTLLMKWFASAVLLLSALFGAMTASAATRTAASCSTGDVQTAVSGASPGDTVKVPAGTCSWSGNIAISGITLMGAGKDASTGTTITSGGVTMTKHASQITRLSGFRFTAGGNHGSVVGSASARAFVIDNNYFYSSGGGDVYFMNINVNGGVLHHNDFYMNPSSGGGPDVFAIHPGEGWSQATTMGTADTQGPAGGERNIYFEDNTFTNCLETCPDGDDGARLVIRHNKYYDSSIVFHSGKPNDTSTDGHRHFEIYENEFHRAIANNNINKWIWVRGGSGVIANNYMDAASSSEFGGKNQIILSVGCPGSPAWPVDHQIGQTVLPATSPAQPLLIFGNSGPGSSGSSFLILNGSEGGGVSCGSPTTYVQSGRDYMTSNTWGWKPFTYPHPLVTGGGGNTGTGPTPPTGVQAVAN